MIGYLEGNIKHVDCDRCLLLVNGIGYEVLIHAKTASLTMGAQQFSFYIHHHIREDGQSLFGFSTTRERDLFRLLITCQGVGPKLALLILDGLTESVLVRAVAEKDAARLTCVKGVGARMAERLVVELKPKLSKWQPNILDASTGSQPESSEIEDVVTALTQLGYQPGMVMDKVRALFEPGIGSDALLKKCLQSFAKV